MIRFLRNLWQSRELLSNLVQRDLKVRYKDSVLGFFWSIGKPLLLMLIFHFVFAVVLGMKLREDRLPFSLHLLTALLAWSFMAGALGEGVGCLIANANLIKKVQLSAEVFPVATVISNLVHFLLALVVLFIFLLLFHLHLSPWLMLIPFLILLQMILVLSLTLIVSALNVFYRDVANLMEVVLTMWFYFTPVIYPIYLAKERILKDFPEPFYYLFLSNPMTPIVVAYRRLILYGGLGTTEFADSELLGSLAISGAVILALFAVSIRIFRHYSESFADEL